MGYTSKSVSIFYVSLVGIAKTFYIYTSIIFSFRSRQEGKTIIILPLFIKKKILNKSNFRLRGFTHRVSHVLGSEALHTGFRMTLKIILSAAYVQLTNVFGFYRILAKILKLTVYRFLDHPVILNYFWSLICISL